MDLSTEIFLQKPPDAKGEVCCRHDGLRGLFLGMEVLSGGHSNECHQHWEGGQVVVKETHILKFQM